eukprot:523424_1
MANYVEEEGQQTGGSNLERWFKQNNLDALVDAFKGEDLSLEDLVDLHKSEQLDLYCQELNIKRTHKMLLIAKIKKMDQSQKQVIRIIMTQKEQDSLDQLNERQQTIASLEKRLNDSLVNVRKESTFCLHEMERKFKDLMIKIQNKQKELTQTLKAMEQQEIDKINANLKRCKDEGSKVDNAIQTCDQLLSHNTNLRKEKIVSIVSKITNVPLNEVPNPTKFSFLFDDKAAYSFISAVCHVECGHPLPVITELKTESITTNAATVQWQAVLLKKDMDIMTSSKLFMRFEYVNDEMDEKEKESKIESTLILFDKNKKQYSYQFDNLEMNCAYDFKMNAFEQSKSSNDKRKRSDFKSVPVHFRTLHVVGKDGTLTVASNETKTLKANYSYEFTSVVINSGGILTTDAWNPDTKTGGTLLIKSWTHFIVKENAQIQLNGKGYCGGRRNKWSGESYNKPSIQSGERNFGGGGGAGHNSYGGGGGYRTPGKTSTYQTNDNGGCTYGDAQLSILHLGSGGGSGSQKGGNGGGALKIECDKFENYGKITVNGENHPSDTYAGCGSGGSIYIVCNDFVMDTNNKRDNVIHALGGVNTLQTGERGGDGGDGRIRITTAKTTATITIATCVDSGQIQPNPYVG